MFTRQHYKSIAETIKNSSVDNEEKRKIVDDLCDTFSQDNPRFVSDKFTEACGL